MLVYLRSRPTWRAENSVNIWNLLWLSRPLIVWTDQGKILISTFPSTLTSKRAKNVRDENIFFNVHIHSFMSRTAITLKFKMCLFLDEASYWAETLLKDTNLPHLMPDVDNNFGGSLGLDFRKWWRHVQPKNCYCQFSIAYIFCADNVFVFALLSCWRWIGIGDQGGEL